MFNMLNLQRGITLYFTRWRQFTTTLAYHLFCLSHLLFESITIIVTWDFEQSTKCPVGQASN